MSVRVLWLIKGLGLGGAEKLLTLAAPRVDRSRYAYEAAYFLPWKSALVRDLEAQGIPVTCLHLTRPYDPFAIGCIARLLRDHRIDLVHAHLPYSGVLGRLAARRVGIPCVYTEHNIQERHHRLTRLANQATMRMCAHTIAVSDQVRDSLQRSRLSRDASITTILNGVDVDGLADSAQDGVGVREEFGIPADRPIVGVVNVFRPQKRLDLWVRAAQAIADAYPRASFLVVGEGPDRPEIERLAAGLGLAGRITFTGLRRDAPRLMAAFDVFMLSSTYEGLPVAVLEAMALGRAVVATRVGGVPTAIEDERSGLLAPSGHPAALAARVVRLLQDGAFRARLGAAARERVRGHFSIESMVRATEQVYAEVMATFGHQSRTGVPQHERVVS